MGVQGGRRVFLGSGGCAVGAPWKLSRHFMEKEVITARPRGRNEAGLWLLPGVGLNWGQDHGSVSMAPTGRRE